MEPYFHMRTAFLVNSVQGLILFMCMLYVARARKTYPGFYYWTASTLLFFAANILTGLRNTVPDFLSIVVSNIAFVATFLVILYGLSLFVDKPHRAWPYLTILLFASAGLCFFTYVQPNVCARIMIISLLLCFTTIYTVIVFKKNISPLLMGSNLILVVSLTIGGLLSLGRAIYTALFEFRLESFFSASALQVVSVIITTGMYTFVCFGLCILNFQRMERDLVKATDEVKTLKGILPICAACKKIRDDKGYWRQVESYIEKHSAATFSHGICPDCMGKLYPEVSARHDDTKKG